MELKPGFKQTDLGLIPEDWKVLTLRDIASSVRNAIVGGPFGSDLVSNDYVEYGVPVIRGQNMVGRTLSGSYVFVTPDKAKSLESNLAEAGDLIFTQRGTLGQVCLVPQSPFPGFLVSQSQMKLTVNRAIANPIFYYYVCKSSIQQEIIRQNTVQTGIPHINLGILGKIPVPGPSLEEQQAIAEALSDVDELIESLEQLIAKKRLIKQGTMQALLSGGQRLSGFTGEWTKKYIGQVLTIRHGKEKRLVEDRNGEYPILASGGKIGTSNRFLCDKPSVLIGRKGTIDNPQYMSTPFWCVDTLFYSDVPETNNAKFLFYKFCLIDWRQYNEASGVPSLNAKTIENIEISIPRTDEQIAIVKVLDEIEATILLLESTLLKVKSLKTGMMQQLLTGKIRLIQPASNVSKSTEQKQIATIHKPHSSEFEDAVIIAVLAACFASAQWPLSRFRYTKFSYLLRRRSNKAVDSYLKKAAGPYNPRTRYGGPERITVQKGYSQKHSNGTYSGFLAGEKIEEAEKYFETWFGKESLTWLKQFQFEKHDQLELLTTVDMAIVELRKDDSEVSLESVKQLIHNDPEWAPKLDRSIFSDINIDRAIKWSANLFGA